VVRLARTVIASVVLVLAVSHCVVHADTPEQLFDRGNDAYENGEYEAAAEAYRSVLRYRVRDPIVEYNLGNAEFRLGNLGRSILHYERARRMDPTDPDIRVNLEHARSFCFDRVEPSRNAAPVRWLLVAQDRLGPDRQAWLALVLFWIAAAIVAAGLVRPAGWSAAHGWILSLVLVALLAGASSWYATHQRLEGQRLAVVMSDIVEVLAGPGHNNPALFTVHEGLTLEVRAEREEWLQVGLPNGLNGWVVREAVEPV